MPNRPQARTGGATTFGDTIQIDLFTWDGQLFLLILDEATRYKTCDKVPGQEAEQLMESILNQWIYVFGPPGRLVLDQQSSLMSHETGAECERLNIERCPRGTTSGQGASQHTGTGLVERRVALTKHTMNKLHAELIRQGLQPEAQEIAREAAMAQNITLNYNGWTPCMAVFGVLPRGFYNIENDGAMATRGPTQTDLTVFERAMRIRQAALAQVHQAVAETREARAAKSRPHQLEVSQLVPGTSEVEFHRDLPGDPGWRGPALLLRVDTDEGTAVIQYQGRPYLVGLRHIRPFKGIFMVEIPDNDALHRLMRYTENLASYKIYYAMEMGTCSSAEPERPRSS